MSKPRVFVSYVQDNREVVTRLVTDLRQRGLDVWFDRDALTPGVFWRDEVRRAIHEHERFVACFSREYSQRIRTYMNEELTLAIEEIRLRGTSLWFVPVLLSGEIPDLPIAANRSLRDIQYLHLDTNDSNAWDESVEKLTRALRSVGESVSLQRPRKPPISKKPRSRAPERRRSTPVATGAIIAGRYRIVEHIATGGFSYIHLAVDEVARARVVLRQLGYVPRKDDLRALATEVRLSQTVRHPNVGARFDLIKARQGVFTVEEYVAGVTLQQVVQSAGRVERTLGIRYAKELTAGIAALHDKAVVHCDIKPANVMIDTRGTVRIIDLSGAMMAESHHKQIVGTPLYMAPELFEGLHNSFATDIYSLGLLLFEMFTGEILLNLPSDSLFSDLGTIPAYHRAARTAKLSSLVPALGDEIHAIVASCLEEDPMTRPAARDLVFAWSKLGNT